MSSAKAALIGRRQFGPDDLVLGPSAEGRLRDFQKARGGHLVTDLYRWSYDWKEFCLYTLNRAARRARQVHFDLTYLKDADDVLQSRGKYAATITAIELRFIRTNCHNFLVKPKFYRNDMEVQPPWAVSEMAACPFVSACDDSIDSVAARFKERIFTAADKGKPSQRDVMIVWLDASGQDTLFHFCETLDLAGSSFGAILGCLTKNMIASQGPHLFYTTSRLAGGNRQYDLLPDITPPLRRAFEAG